MVVTVSRDDSEPAVLGSARIEASVYLGASGDLRAETHTLSPPEHQSIIQ